MHDKAKASVFSAAAAAGAGVIPAGQRLCMKTHGSKSKIVAVEWDGI